MKRMKINLDNSLTFKEGFLEFIENCKSRNLRQGTLNHYQDSYKQLVKFIEEDTAIEELNKKTVDNFVKAYKANSTANSQTVYTYARDLKTILYFFMRMEYMQSFKITLPKVDKTAVETYTDAELRILLKKPDLKKSTFCNYRDWTIINFLLSTGIRSNSLINIKISEVDLDNNVVYINVTKNRKPLIIPLNITIQKILKEYLKIRKGNDDDYLFYNVYGKQLCRKTLNGSLATYNNNRGITKTGIHRFRHTFAKKYILAGGNPVYLQKLLGHSSLTITENYINVLASDLKREMNNFNILQEFNNTTIKIK